MLYLASSSPRRREILSKAGISFEVLVPNVDERLLDPSLPPSALAKEEARLKCYAIHALHPNDEVLAALTAYHYLGKGREIARTVKSYVTFAPFGEEEARAYIERKKPLDKAGGYGIQEHALHAVRR